MHDYVKRRQLTEAAKLLVFSEKPIVEIAFLAGYESQQAFADSFKAMSPKSAGTVPGRAGILPAAALVLFK